MSSSKHCATRLNIVLPAEDSMAEDSSVVLMTEGEEVVEVGSTPSNAENKDEKSASGATGISSNMNFEANAVGPPNLATWKRIQTTLVENFTLLKEKTRKQEETLATKAEELRCMTEKLEEMLKKEVFEFFTPPLKSCPRLI